MAFCIIYVTHENLEEAKKVGNHLLEKKMIACANYFPITSSFLWKENIQYEEEFISILKTSLKNWERVKEEIKKVHPYDTPAIIKFQVEANEDFEKWIEEETNYTL